MNDSDVVMAEYANQLLGRNLCADSGHKLMSNDYGLMILDQNPGLRGDGGIMDYLSNSRRRMTTKNAAATALKTNTAIL